MIGRIGFVQVHVAGLKGEASARIHGVASVQYQIHDYLFDLDSVRFYLAQIWSSDGLQVDMFADQPFQEVSKVFHQAIEIDNLWLKHLLPAESQQLLSQGRGALRSFFDFLNLSLCRAS